MPEAYLRNDSTASSIGPWQLGKSAQFPCITLLKILADFGFHVRLTFEAAHPKSGLRGHIRPLNNVSK